jgi:hypothetical protein
MEVVMTSALVLLVFVFLTLLVAVLDTRPKFTVRRKIPWELLKQLKSVEEPSLFRVPLSCGAFSSFPSTSHTHGASQVSRYFGIFFGTAWRNLTFDDIFTFPLLLWKRAAWRQRTKCLLYEEHERSKVNKSKKFYVSTKVSKLWEVCWVQSLGANQFNFEDFREKSLSAPHGWSWTVKLIGYRFLLECTFLLISFAFRFPFHCTELPSVPGSST